MTSGVTIGLFIAFALAVLLWPRSSDKGVTRIVRRVTFNAWGILSAVFVAVALIVAIAERVK